MMQELLVHKERVVRSILSVIVARQNKFGCPLLQMSKVLIFEWWPALLYESSYCKRRKHAGLGRDI